MNHEGMHGAKAHAGHTGHHAHMVEDFRRRFIVCIILTIPVLLLSPMIQEWLGLQRLAFGGSAYVLLLFSAGIYFYGGFPFMKGFVDESRKKLPGMMTLIAVAITVAFVYSTAVALGLSGKLLFWELATLVDIMLLGHWIEMKSVMGASRALEELVSLMPKDAHLVHDDGTTEDIPVTSLTAGRKFLVKPGEKFPADGLVVDGHSSVDESLLTGESRPVHKMTGDKVIGGALNGEGAVTVEVTKAGADSFLSQVVELVRQAQESKSRSQDIANRAAMWLTIIAITVGVITLIAWLSIRHDFAYAIERMVTVMVITCPHALGLAVPLVIAVSTAIAAKNGLLIRDRAAFEGARNVNAVVFDKTGTLTEGKFGVRGIVPFGGVEEKEILRLAASVENMSEHPIARGIIAEAGKQSIKPGVATDFEVMRGMGVRGIVDGREILAVSRAYMDGHGIKYDESRIAEHLAQGQTIVFILDSGAPIGVIALGDSIRPESKPAIDALHAMGIKCIMLTGDSDAVAKAVSDTIGLDEYMAEVLPDAKAAKVRDLMSRGMRVAMTGDGVNDAPALAVADVGIAIGAGTDVAVETADIVLVRSNPGDVVAIFKLARATYGKMIQNLFWATGYNVVAIPLAAGVLAGYGIMLGPAAGAVLMSISTVIVAVNARIISIAK